MQTYSQYRPTQFDAAGLAIPDRQDWLVAPAGINRDTPAGSIEQSNFTALQKALSDLDPGQDDHETHRFGHWACGWFEIVLVRPGSACAEKAHEIAQSLEDYPVIDETEHSEAEYEAAAQSWGDQDAEAAAHVLTEALGARRESADLIAAVDECHLRERRVWRFYEFLREFGCLDEFHYEAGAPYWRLSEHEAKRITRKAFARFLRMERDYARSGTQKV